MVNDNHHVAGKDSCNTCVAQPVRVMMTCRGPLLPPAYGRQYEESAGRNSLSWCCEQSDLVLMDTASGTVVERHRAIGTKAHGLVAWHSWLILLDSGNGALARFEPNTGKREELWRVCRSCPSHRS